LYFFEIINSDEVSPLVRKLDKTCLNMSNKNKVNATVK